MGVKGLLPFVKNASRKCHISEFKGCTVAVDTYCWLHKGAFGCADKLVLGINTDMHIKYCLKYIHFLQYYKIKVILVFDGQHLPAKSETEKKRRNQKKHAYAQATEYMRLNKTELAHTYFRQCVDITHHMALTLIKECRKMNVDCIVAPYEADAQLAYLNMQGIAELVITEDSDLILFGCTKIMFKLNIQDGYGVLLEKDLLNQTVGRFSKIYSFDKFRYMCILSGCDYLDSLPGIGLKTAQKAIFITEDLDIYKILPRLPRYLNMQKLVVPEDYINGFKLADATFQYQVVYNPLKRALVRLTDPEKSETKVEDLRNSGEIYNDKLAFQLALGNVDPIHLKVLDDWDPDIVKLSSTSIWSKTYRKYEFEKPLIMFSTTVTKTPKNNKVRSSLNTAEDNSIIEENKARYDEYLNEELKAYATIQPPQKRQKLESSSQCVEEINNSKIEINNPFLKQKKSLSKFRCTEDSRNGIKSHFFSNTSDNKKSLDEVTENSITEIEYRSSTENDENDTEVLSESDCDNIYSSVEKLNLKMFEKTSIQNIPHVHTESALTFSSSDLKSTNLPTRSDDEPKNTFCDNLSPTEGFNLSKFKRSPAKGILYTHNLKSSNSVDSNISIVTEQYATKDDKENKWSDEESGEIIDCGRESPILTFTSDFQINKNRQTIANKDMTKEQNKNLNVSNSTTYVNEDKSITVSLNKIESNIKNKRSLHVTKKYTRSTKKQATLHHYFDKMKSHQ